MSVDPALTTDSEQNLETRRDLAQVNLARPLSAQTSLKMPRYQIIEKKVAFDEIAPDQSGIRWLTRLNNNGMCHCTLLAGKTSLAVKHKTVEELWYVIKGRGEIWLLDHESNDHGVTKDLYLGVSIAIPPNVSFQFRNSDLHETLEIIISTSPPWPGKEEALTVPGNPKWAASISHSESTAWIRAKKVYDSYSSLAQLMSKPGSTFYASANSETKSQENLEDALVEVNESKILPFAAAKRNF